MTIAHIILETYHVSKIEQYDEKKQIHKHCTNCSHDKTLV